MSRLDFKNFLPDSSYSVWVCFPVDELKWYRFLRAVQRKCWIRYGWFFYRSPEFNACVIFVRWCQPGIGLQRIIQWHAF